jgi:uncharacterized membrane protein YccC
VLIQTRTDITVFANAKFRPGFESGRYARRLLRLAFLAPEIVEAIAAGDQPPELTAEVLAEPISLCSGPRKKRAVGIAS